MDDIIINKINVIEKCLKRINEEYVGHEDDFVNNYTKQDSIILNLQRACEAAIDLGIRVVRLKNLGVPQSSRDVFNMLEKDRIISSQLCKKLQLMVGFRNIAVHDYQKINLDIVLSIISTNLTDFKDYSEAIATHFK